MIKKEKYRLSFIDFFCGHFPGRKGLVNPNFMGDRSQVRVLLNLKIILGIIQKINAGHSEL